MTEPPPRPHLVVVQLDVGYTVSMGATILACETLERVLASVHALLLPHVGDADGTAQAAYDYFVRGIAPPPPPPKPPEPPEPEDPTLPPFDPRIDTMPMDLRDEEADDFVGSTGPMLADERANLAIAVAAYRAGTIDLDELRAGRTRYYPSATDTDLEAAVLEAQGLDPTRFGNGSL